MFVLGLLTAAAYWPGIISPAVSPRFAVLSVIATGLLLWRRQAIPFTRAHLAGTLLVLWAAFSVLWSPASLDSGDALWQVAILPAVCFCLGSQGPSLRPLFAGAAVGLGLSSAIAIAQSLGWDGLPEIASPSGLFLNANYLGEAAAIVLVAAISERMWVGALVVPSLVLTEARGALLGAGVAVALAIWRRFPVTAFSIVVAAGVAVVDVTLTKSGIGERFDVWTVAAANLDWLGHGIGSFWILPHHTYADGIPTHAHNDFLELASDLGPIGVALFAWFAWELRGGLDTARLVLIALAVEAAFAFPTHMPVTLALGASCAGFAVRGRPVLRRHALRSRGTVQESLA